MKAKEVTLADLRRHESGPLLSPRDVARISEGYLSEDRVFRDVKACVLPAKRIPTAMRCRWRITFTDVRAYLKALTILEDAA